MLYVVICYRAILESSNGALAYHRALDDKPAQLGRYFYDGSWLHGQTSWDHHMSAHEYF